MNSINKSLVLLSFLSIAATKADFKESYEHFKHDVKDWYATIKHRIMGEKPALCMQDACKKGASCTCYCSKGCNPRAIKEKDSPVFVNNMCFCKQWDADHYQVSCQNNTITDADLKKIDEHNVCPHEKGCVNETKCMCYCSRQCGLRAKKEDDRSIYVQHDARGNYCYCNQSDLNDIAKCKPGLAQDKVE